MRYNRIKVEPFDTIVIVCVGKSIKHCLDEFNKQFEPNHSLNSDNYLDVDGAVLHNVVDNYSYWALMLQDKVKSDLIVHEVFHLVMGITNNASLQWSKSSDEWYAYCMQNTYKKVLEFYNQKK